MNASRSSEKIEVFETYMKGDHALLHIDSRKEGVQVPAQHRDNPSLTLKVSYLFRGETLHDETGITSYLKFSGEYTQCVLPWEAIWGITSSEGDTRLWPQDMPKELVAQAARAKLREVGQKLFGRKAEAKASKGEKAKPQLQDISAKAPTKEPGSKGPLVKPDTPPERPSPQLKRVK